MNHKPLASGLWRQVGVPSSGVLGEAVTILRTGLPCRARNARVPGFPWASAVESQALNPGLAGADPPWERICITQRAGLHELVAAFTAFVSVGPLFNVQRAPAKTR